MASSQPVIMVQSAASAKKNRLLTSAASSQPSVYRRQTTPSPACTSRDSSAVARCTSVNIWKPTKKWTANCWPRVTGSACISPVLRLLVR